MPRHLAAPATNRAARDHPGRTSVRSRLWVAVATFVTVANGAVAIPLAPIAAASTGLPYATTTSDPAAPGVTHETGRLTTSAGSQAVQIVTADPAEPVVSVEAAMSNDLVTGLETTSSLARRRSVEGHRVVAAVNGDVWNASVAVQGPPNGILVHAGELWSATVGAKPAFAIAADRTAQVGPIRQTATLAFTAGGTPGSLPISRVNGIRQAGELVLFTPHWGASTGTAATGTEVILAGLSGPLTPNGSVAGMVQGVRPSAGNTPVASGKMVLSATGDAATILGALAVGSTVRIDTTISPGWELSQEIITGRETVVRDGVAAVSPVSTSSSTAHPRTAVGVTADGRVVLVTIDGRQPGYSVGITLDDLASFLLSRGVVQAINFDGGGSTAMAVRLPGDIGPSLVNRPSDGTERAVSDSLIIVSSAPTGPLATTLIFPASGSTMVGTTTAHVVKGVDAADNGVPVAASTVVWSASGDAGTIDATGRFTATQPGGTTITATSGSQTAQVEVTVVPDTAAPVASRPNAHFLTGAGISTGSIRAVVSWSAATDVGTGVASYEVRRSTNGAPWVSLGTFGPRSRSVRVTLVPGTSYRFGVRATDLAGNVGALATGPPLTARVYQEKSATFSGTWGTAWSTSYLGGRLRFASATSARASIRLTGWEVAWVASVGPKRGSARLYLDGVYAGAASTYRSSRAYRLVVWRHAWSSSGTHTVRISPAGTAGHPRIDVDAFAVIGPSRPDPVIVAAGDIATCSSTTDTATANLLASIPGTVVTLGDNAYENGTPAEFANCYNPTWGKARARTRPVPGNHDYGTAGAAGYFGYFGSRAGNPGSGWYAYDIGSWRIYALNSNCAQIGGCVAGSAEEAWLRADLAAHPRACTLAYWHHPRFSSGIHGNDPQTAGLWETLYEANADVILNGHDHDYERFAPQAPDGSLDASTGIREFVVGTGGAELRVFSTIAANSQRRAAGTAGVLKVTLRTGGYSWQFVPVAGRTFTDSGYTACH